MAAFADRTLTLRDGALGQDMTRNEAPPALDAEGRIQLPPAVRSQLEEGSRIAIEIRPEGVLLRAEQEAEDNTELMLQDMLPRKQHERNRWRLLRRNGQENRS
jgi:DNA-binding transcriptional regulator/RsmH inhibitor MraZ